LISLYYNADLSLSEIAEETGLTRQGVRDAVSKGKNALFEYEKALGFAEKMRRIKETAKEIEEALKQGDVEKAAALIKRIDD